MDLIFCVLATAKVKDIELERNTGQKPVGFCYSELYISANEPKTVPKMRLKGSQNSPKMIPKLYQNGPQNGPKFSRKKKCPKTVHNWSKNDQTFHVSGLAGCCCCSKIAIYYVRSLNTFVDCTSSPILTKSFLTVYLCV